MGQRVTGGCLCGAGRYECTGDVGRAAYCHGTDCRRVAGSAFNVGVRLDTDRFRAVTGDPREFGERADSRHDPVRPCRTRSAAAWSAIAPHVPSFGWDPT